MAHQDGKLHPADRFSRVARPVDPRRRTNLAILILIPALAAAVAGWNVYNGAAPVDAGVAFAVAALVVFLTWALSREIAPDSNAAAFIAVALALPPLALGADVAFVQLVLALFLARVVNRIVGPPAMATDLVIIGGLLLAVAGGGNARACAFVAAVAFALDGMLERPKAMSWLVAAWALVVGGAVMWWGPLGVKQLIGSGEAAATILAPIDAMDPRLLAATGLLAGVSVLLAATSPPPRGRCDMLDETPDHGRVAWGAIVVVLCALATYAEGSAAVLALYPVWAVLAAAAVGRLMPDRAGDAPDPDRGRAAPPPSPADEAAVAADLETASGPSDEITIGRNGSRPPGAQF